MSPASFLYRDILGRAWATDRLDRLLADASVRAAVEQGVRVGGRREDASWQAGKVLAWARRRYRREEPAALMLLLITRFFDLGADLGDGGFEA